jgi:hypothetical protein
MYLKEVAKLFRLIRREFSNTYLHYLYFRTVHVVIFILFKPTHALFFKTHSHSHLKQEIAKMFVKHIIKTLQVSVTIV